MKKVFKYTLIIGLLILFSQSIYAQRSNMPDITAEFVCLGEDSILVAETNSIPPRRIYKFDGYKYEITMRIKFSADAELIEESFGIVYVLSDGKKNESLICPNKLLRISPREYEYSFKIKSKKDDWLEIYLVPKDDLTDESDVHIYKNTSNRITIFLDHLLSMK